MDDPMKLLGIGGGDGTMAALYCAAKAGGVLACAGVSAFAIRRRAAAARHLVWALGLAGALAVLPLALALPRWGLPVLSTSETASIASGDIAFETSRTEAPAPVVAATMLEAPSGSPEALASPVRAPRPQPGAIATAWRMVVGAWPLAIWFAGTSAVLAWYTIGWATVWRIGRKAERITDRRWVDAASEAAERLGMTDRVTLLRGGPSAMPVTWGTLRPVILLPAEADEWPADRRRAVLMHELAHVWDPLESTCRHASLSIL